MEARGQTVTHIATSVWGIPGRAGAFFPFIAPKAVHSDELLRPARRLGGLASCLAGGGKKGRDSRWTVCCPL